MQLLSCLPSQGAASPRSAFVTLAKKSLALLAFAGSAFAAHATTYDANSLTIASSSGDGVTTITTTGASGGNIRVFNSDVIGDQITFSVSAATTAEYALSVRFFNNPNRGIVRLSINGVEQGALHDGYHPSGSFVTVDYGKVLLTSGTQQIKFTVTGHNTSSSNYRIGFDTLTLDALAARTDITTFATITDALNSGVPLYAPPGTYALPSNFTPTANIDILGDINPASRPVFQVQNPSFLPSDYSLRFQGIDFVGASGPGAKLLGITFDTFDLPNYTVFDCTFDECSPIVWGTRDPVTKASITGQIIRRMEIRRFTIADANRGLHAGGRVDDYDFTDFTIANCGRFGICVGPNGKGIIDSIEAYMKRGMVARGIISGTKINDVNNSQLNLTGNNVVVRDMDLLNMVLPATYYTPGNETKYPLDSEPFYTKVEYLTVNNLHIENDGAFQAMWGHKGASAYDESPISPEGRDGVATDVTMVNTGIRQARGVWHQTHGACVYKNFTMVGRTDEAVIIHNDSASGTLTIENWVDVTPNPTNDPLFATKFPGVKNRSLNNVSPAPAPVAVTLINSPTLTEYAP